jgi:predicted site-specific integrase-resolvase
MSALKKRKIERKLYRRATAAALLDTSVTMMKRLEREGRLTAVRLGGRDVFYRAQEIERLLAEEQER